MADNDFGRIAAGGTGANAGFLEIATADDGTEPIYVSQYTGVFSSLVRRAYLLDHLGHTNFPGVVTANYFTCRNTTLCTNLNADLFDGYHSDYYVNLSYDTFVSQYNQYDYIEFLRITVPSGQSRLSDYVVFDLTRSETGAEMSGRAVIRIRRGADNNASYNFYVTNFGKSYLPEMRMTTDDGVTWKVWIKCIKGTYDPYISVKVIQCHPWKNFTIQRNGVTGTPSGSKYNLTASLAGISHFAEAFTDGSNQNTFVRKAGDIMSGSLTTEGKLEVHLPNSTTANPMLLLHNEGAVHGNMSYRRDTIFHFVNTNTSTGTDYRPLKARYYLAYTTDLCTNLNADLLDGNHENAFLRYRGSANTAGEGTLWSQIGIKQYNNAYPDDLSNGVYGWGAVISLAGSSSRLDIWYNHYSSDYSNNGIQYRSGWDNNKRPWRMILDSVNYTNYADGRYVNVTGDTMTGALNFANGTRNNIGDDCGFGDGNVGGCACFQGLNGDTGIALIQQGAAWSGGNHYRFTWNGSNMTSSSIALWNNLNADLLDGLHQTSFLRTNGANQYVQLIGGNGNTAGWRLVMDAGPMGGWTINSMTLLVNSRHQGTGIISLVFHTTNEAGTTYIGEIRYFGSLASMGSNTWRMFYNTSDKRLRLFWYFSDYSSCQVSILNRAGYTTNIANGTWYTSLPSNIGTELPTYYNVATQAHQLYTTRTIFGQPFNGTQNVGGLMTSSSIFVNTGDATLKVYDGEQQEAISDGNICLQTSINGTDGQSHSYPTQHQARCNLCLQPRGGQVYIGQNPNGGNTSYKLVVNGAIYATSTIRTAGLFSAGEVQDDAYGYYNCTRGNNTSMAYSCYAMVMSGTRTFGLGYRNYDIILGSCTTSRTINPWVYIDGSRLQMQGSVYATGAMTAKSSGSDIRLKKDIQSYNAMNIIKQFRSVKYHWNEIAKANSEVYNNDYDQYGLIAQDLLAGGYKQWVKDVFKDYYTIEYERLIPVVWKGLQEVDSEVDKLKKEVAILKKRIAILEGRKSLSA